MRHRHGGVPCQKHECNRFADQKAASDHERTCARRVDLRLLEHPHAATGRAGSQPLATVEQEPCGLGGQSIDVLGRVDLVQHLLSIQMIGQRELH